MKRSPHRLPDGVTPMTTNLVRKPRPRRALVFAVAALMVVIGFTVLNIRPSQSDSDVGTPTATMEITP